MAAAASGITHEFWRALIAKLERSMGVSGAENPDDQADLRSFIATVKQQWLSGADFQQVSDLLLYESADIRVDRFVAVLKHVTDLLMNDMQYFESYQLSLVCMLYLKSALSGQNFMTDIHDLLLSRDFSELSAQLDKIKDYAALTEHEREAIKHANEKFSFGECDQASKIIQDLINPGPTTPTHAFDDSADADVMHSPSSPEAAAGATGDARSVAVVPTESNLITYWRLALAVAKAAEIAEADRVARSIQALEVAAAYEAAAAVRLHPSPTPNETYKTAQLMWQVLKEKRGLRWTKEPRLRFSELELSVEHNDSIVIIPNFCFPVWTKDDGYFRWLDGFKINREASALKGVRLCSSTGAAVDYAYVNSNAASSPWADFPALTQDDFNAWVAHVHRDGAQSDEYSRFIEALADTQTLPWCEDYKRMLVTALANHETDYLETLIRKFSEGLATNKPFATKYGRPILEIIFRAANEQYAEFTAEQHTEFLKLYLAFLAKNQIYRASKIMSRPAETIDAATLLGEKILLYRGSDPLALVQGIIAPEIRRNPGILTEGTIFEIQRLGYLRGYGFSFGNEKFVRNKNRGFDRIVSEYKAIKTISPHVESLTEHAAAVAASAAGAGGAPADTNLEAQVRRFKNGIKEGDEAIVGRAGLPLLESILHQVARCVLVGQRAYVAVLQLLFAYIIKNQRYRTTSGISEAALRQADAIADTIINYRGDSVSTVLRYIASGLPDGDAIKGAYSEGTLSIFERFGFVTGHRPDRKLSVRILGDRGFTKMLRFFHTIQGKYGSAVSTTLSALRPNVALPDDFLIQYWQEQSRMRRPFENPLSLCDQPLTDAHFQRLADHLSRVEISLPVMVKFLNSVYKWTRSHRQLLARHLGRNKSLMTRRIMPLVFRSFKKIFNTERLLSDEDSFKNLHFITGLLRSTFVGCKGFGLRGWVANSMRKVYVGYMIQSLRQHILLNASYIAEHSKVMSTVDRAMVAVFRSDGNDTTLREIIAKLSREMALGLAAERSRLEILAGDDTSLHLKIVTEIRKLMKIEPILDRIEKQSRLVVVRNQLKNLDQWLTNEFEKRRKQAADRANGGVADRDARRLGADDDAAAAAAAVSAVALAPKADIELVAAAQVGAGDADDTKLDDAAAAGHEARARGSSAASGVDAITHAMFDDNDDQASREGSPRGSGFGGAIRAAVQETFAFGPSVSAAAREAAPAKGGTPESSL